MRAPGLDVWARALQGYLSKPAASCSGLGVKWHFTEKASRTRKTKTTCLLPVLSQLRYLPFSATPVFFFFFFLFSFLSVFSDLCLTERVRVNSQDGCTGSAEDEHFYTQTHQDFNMYRGRRWTMPSFIPRDCGGLMRHPLVALWSSSVKVYALSHVRKDPLVSFFCLAWFFLLVVDVYHQFYTSPLN